MGTLPYGSANSRGARRNGGRESAEPDGDRAAQTPSKVPEMHTPITNKGLMTDATNNEKDVWDDPPDEWYHLESWGIDDWCRSHNLEPAPERNVLGAWLPCQSRWLAHDTYFDGAARALAKTARLPVSWRVDWSPLMKWLEAGYDVSAVRRAIERSARRDGYVPPTSLQFFDEEIRERTQWETVNGAPDTLGDVLDAEPSPTIPRQAPTY